MTAFSLPRSDVIERAFVPHAPGQDMKRCRTCGRWLVDTGDGIWAHALNVDLERVPCNSKNSNQ